MKNRKVLLLLPAIGAAALLAACSGQAADLEATATQVAVDLATVQAEAAMLSAAQTAQARAPTATPSPTLTPPPAVRPSDTPVPAPPHTPASTAPARPTPGPVEVSAARVTFTNATGGTLYMTLRGPQSYDFSFEFVDLPDLIASPPEPKMIVPGTYEYTMQMDDHSLTGVTTLVAAGSVAHGVTVKEYSVTCVTGVAVVEEPPDEEVEVLETFECSTIVYGYEWDVSLPGLP
jgi:hypothetical protein